MATRSRAHAEEEKAIFDAFLAAHPSFASTVKEAHQPDDEFPDVIVKLTDDAEVDFELGEWLDGAQMAEAKRYERLEEAILHAIGSQGGSPSRHFRAVMLTPRADVMKFDPADRGGFREELWALVGETDQRWPTERFWHSPQGRLCRELGDSQLLEKYLSPVHFDPLVVRGKPRPWPTGQPWIFVEGRGGSYSPETAFRAMAGILGQKIRHYGRFTRPTRLIIYYGKAVAYNTPYVGIETREFADVPAVAAEVVRGQTAFEKIHLLNALEPGLEGLRSLTGLHSVLVTMGVHLPTDPELIPIRGPQVTGSQWERGLDDSL
jgi:hypothetical protein